MPIAEGMKAVNDVLTQPNWDINQLLLAARDRAQQLGTGAGLPPGFAFGLNNCQTLYGVNNQELLTWFLGLMLAEYTVGLLAQKAEEGHCQQHRKKPDFKRCPDMAKEHMRMLGFFKDALKNLVTEIETLEKQTQLP